MSTTALPDGIVTPLVAFLTPAGNPDPDAVSALIEHQIAGGVSGVLVNGSMGELGTLTVEQRRAMVTAVVGTVGGRMPVWAGVAGLGTADTVEGARDAAERGADALLVLPPLFFDHSDAELTTHFEAVAAATALPVLAYDVPPRTPRKLPVSLVRGLAEAGVIHGVKDSSGDLTTGRRMCQATEHIDGFRAYIGSEVTIDASVVLGFAGAVPGLANIAPAVAVEVFAAARKGDLDHAAAAQRTYVGLLDLLSIPLAGAGPVAVAFDSFKLATAQVLGLPRPSTTAPFAQPDDAFAAAVEAVIAPLVTP